MTKRKLKAQPPQDTQSFYNIPDTDEGGKWSPMHKRCGTNKEWLLADFQREEYMKGSIHTQVYKIQSIIFIALIIFGLKISLIKRRKKWIDKPLEDVKLLMTMIVLEKNYKFKTNLLL